MSNTRKGRKIPMEVMREGLDLLGKDNIVRIGDKRHGAYMFACSMSLTQNSEVLLVSRGRYNSKTIDVLENLKHQAKERGWVLEPTFSTRTDTVKEKGKIRRVSVLQIHIKRREK